MCALNFVQIHSYLKEAQQILHSFNTLACNHCAGIEVYKAQLSALRISTPYLWIQSTGLFQMVASLMPSSQKSAFKQLQS